MLHYREWLFQALFYECQYLLLSQIAMGTPQNKQSPANLVKLECICVSVVVHRHVHIHHNGKTNLAKKLLQAMGRDICNTHPLCFMVSVLPSLFLLPSTFDLKHSKQVVHQV